MRWKYDADGDPSIYKCCFCCHVRTGTIMLGIFHMFLHMLVLSVFAVVLLHPELVRDENNRYNEPITIDVRPFHDGQSNNSRDFVTFYNMTSEDQFLGILLTVGTFIVTIMLVYGAIKGHAGYLMPFFCLQVFDFCVSCLTVVGYFSYIPDMKAWIAAQSNLPFREELLEMNDDRLMLWAVFFVVLTLTIKAYLIGVVWSCYKYLGNQQTRTTSGNRTYGGESTSEDTEMLLPPKYEDVIQLPPPGSSEPPPPPYAQ